MKANMGSVDRSIRVVIALVIAGLYLSGIVTGLVGLIMLGAAIVFVATSAMSFCPLYAPFGLSTCERKSE